MAEVKLKRGKLSMGDREFIEDNVDKMSINEIARTLNRTEAPIKRFIEDNNLISVGFSKEVADDILLRERLHNREYWPMVRDKELMDGYEIAIFEDEWIKLFKQFGDDVVTSEEGQIKELIIAHIHQHRILADEKAFQLELNAAQADRNIIMAIPEMKRDDSHDQEMAMLSGRLHDARAGLQDLSRIYKDLSMQSKELLKALKGTREQRIRHIKDAETSFAGWLYELEDEKKREDWSRGAELFRMAKDKEKERLSEYHQYSDGILDRPILTPESCSEEDE